MMHNKKISLLMISTLGVASTVNANSISFFDPVDGYFDAGEYLAENAYGILPVPMIITEPAVGNGLVLAGIMLHESDELKQKRKALALRSIDGGAKLLTPGISVLGIGATDNGSKIGFAGHRETWGKDKIRYLVAGGYGDINMNFYSQEDLGQDLSLDISMKGFGLMQKLQYRINDTKLFVGISQKYLNIDMSNNDENDLIPPELIDRVDDFANVSPSISSLGAIIEYDSRNNFFLPTAGYDYTFKYDWYGELIGSDYDYQALEAEAVNYWPIKDSFTFGLKLNYQAIYSDTRLPVFAYPDINLRGIPRNRYQGDNVSYGEVELMWEVTPDGYYSLL